MITFKTIKYKNFLSTGQSGTTVYLNRSPTTLIVGHNGAGKSTILDAITFSLFGRPFRDINKPLLINSVNQGGCVVEIEFETMGKNYKIIRGLKPNIFEIYEDGRLVNQDAASRDYQKYLEDNILGGLNERVFKQVVVIGSADHKPFMQLPAASRREIIEELLDIKIFSDMLTIAKEKLSGYKEKLRDLDYNIELMQEKYRIQNENKKKLQVEEKNKKVILVQKIQDEQNQIIVINITINGLLDKKTELLQKIANYDILVGNIKELEKLKIGLEGTSNTTKSNIDFFTKHENCPTCKQHIAEEHKNTILVTSNSKLDELNTAVTKVSDALNQKHANLDVFKQAKKAVEEYERSIYQAQTTISAHQKYIGNLQKEINELDNNAKVTGAQDQLDKIKEELTESKNQRIVMLEDRQYHELVADMLKDGGIKTKIIRQYIPIMNRIINEYLVRFALPIEFTLDEQFNEVIKSRFRDNFQYNNFSEGEKQRIDTALLLAWRSIAKSKNTTNCSLLIMDETFDSSLDGEATEELLNILLEMDKGTNIFIISHKSDLGDKLRSVIEFEKIGNFSRIKAK